MFNKDLICQLEFIKKFLLVMNSKKNYSNLSYKKQIKLFKSIKNSQQ